MVIIRLPLCALHWMIHCVHHVLTYPCVTEQRLFWHSNSTPPVLKKNKNINFELRQKYLKEALMMKLTYDGEC